MLLKILTVAALATFEIYAAIPAGFAFHLSPWIVFFASAAGGLTGVFVVAFLGEKINAFIRKGKPAKEKKVYKHPMLHNIWEKYGVAGLGFVGTFLVGAPVSLAIGVTLNANIHRMVAWCCAGVIARCLVFTLIGFYGVKLFD